MKILILVAAAFALAAVANESSERLPQRDNSDQIEALRRDVDLLLEANVRLEARLSKLETTPPAKQPEQSKPSKLVPSKMASDTPLQPTPVAKYTVDTKPGHWTYPGDLAEHLRTTHGANVDGLSKEQMLNMHDALHESEPVKPAPVVVKQPVQSFVQQPSTCPLGQPCPQRMQPTQQTYQYTAPRRTVFRRW